MSYAQFLSDHQIEDNELSLSTYREIESVGAQIRKWVGAANECGHKGWAKHAEEVLAAHTRKLLRQLQEAQP